MVTKAKLRMVKLNLTIRDVLRASKVNHEHLVSLTVQHPVIEMRVTVNDFLGVDVG